MRFTSFACHPDLVKLAMNTDWNSIQPELNCVCSIHSGEKGEKKHISKNKCWWGVRESDYVCLRQIGGNESRDCTCSHTLKQRSLGN